MTANNAKNTFVELLTLATFSGFQLRKDRSVATLIKGQKDNPSKIMDLFNSDINDLAKTICEEYEYKTGFGANGNLASAIQHFKENVLNEEKSSYWDNVRKVGCPISVAKEKLAVWLGAQVVESERIIDKSVASKFNKLIESIIDNQSGMLDAFNNIKTMRLAESKSPEESSAV